MSYEQRMIVMFILQVNCIDAKDKLEATNLILNVCDESQISRIKMKVDVLKSSPSATQEVRESIIGEMMDDILSVGMSLREGAD